MTAAKVKVSSKHEICYFRSLMPVLLTYCSSFCGGLGLRYEDLRMDLCTQGDHSGLSSVLAPVGLIISL